MRSEDLLYGVIGYGVIGLGVVQAEAADEPEQRLSVLKFEIDHHRPCLDGKRIVAPLEGSDLRL